MVGDIDPDLAHGLAPRAKTEVIAGEERLEQMDRINGGGFTDEVEADMTINQAKQRSAQTGSSR